MFDIEISGVQKLERFAKINFAERAVAFEKMLLRELVERVKDEIVAEIPTHFDEEWLRLYKESFDIYEIKGLQTTATSSQTPEVGFVISSRVAGDWTSVQGDRMVVDFRALTIDEYSAVGAVLEEFSPFAVDRVPHLANYGARVIAKRVRQTEVGPVRDRNDEQSVELLQALRDADAEFKDGPAQIAGKVYFDMVHAVMSMELNKGEIRKPHWRPALRKIDVFLSELGMNAGFHARIKKIFDPKNVNWTRELNPRPEPPEIRLSDLDVLEDFQTRVYRRPRAL